MRIEAMSNNIIKIMDALRYNDRLVSLLLINDSESNFDINDRPEGFESNENNMRKKNQQIINQNSSFCRISPTPFDPNAQEKDKSMIRVYYNNVEYDSELVSESHLHIDIIVAKSLWLAYDNQEKRSLIRPYEISGCIMDAIGRRSGNPVITINFQGGQHLAVNTMFDAFRLYSDYFKPEA